MITDGSGTGPARFIFASEAGTINAWRSGTVAVQKVSNPNAVYKGLAISGDNSESPSTRRISKPGRSTSSAQPLHPSTSDQGPLLMALFQRAMLRNVQNLGGKIYVTYALQDVDKEDDVLVETRFVNFSDTNGHLQQS